MNVCVCIPLELCHGLSVSVRSDNQLLFTFGTSVALEVFDVDVVW